MGEVKNLWKLPYDWGNLHIRHNFGVPRAPGLSIGVMFTNLANSAMNDHKQLVKSLFFR